MDTVSVRRWDRELHEQLNEIWSNILGITPYVVQVQFSANRTDWTPSFKERLEQYWAAVRTAGLQGVPFELHQMKIEMLNVLASRTA